MVSFNVLSVANISLCCLCTLAVVTNGTTAVPCDFWGATNPSSTAKDFQSSWLDKDVVDVAKLPRKGRGPSALQFDKIVVRHRSFS